MQAQPLGVVLGGHLPRPLPLLLLLPRVPLPPLAQLPPPLPSHPLGLPLPPLPLPLTLGLASLGGLLLLLHLLHLLLLVHLPLPLPLGLGGLGGLLPPLPPRGGLGHPQTLQPTPLALGVELPPLEGRRPPTPLGALVQPPTLPRNNHKGGLP